MTAEIAILNKNGVALAADSAVTLRNPDNQKVYNTANKLFMLSKYHPVGIMVYGSAELMGVPWETVIKIFRAELHNELRSAYPVRRALHRVLGKQQPPVSRTSPGIRICWNVPMGSFGG
jgi:hypothetical protein